MTVGTEKPEQDRLVDFRRLRLFVLYPLGALCGVYFLSLWLGPAWDGFRAASRRSSELAPLLEKARGLGLKYEDALSSTGSDQVPVVWCVQNRSEHAVSVDGDPGKPLSVTNYPAMPAYSGSKHQACTPMLLLLEKRGAGRRVAVFFKEAL